MALVTKSTQRLLVQKHHFKSLIIRQLSLCLVCGWGGGERERPRARAKDREEQLRILENSTAALPRELYVTMEMFHVCTVQ